MKGNRGFTNKAKSGAKALAAGWRRAAEKARLEKAGKRVKPGRGR